MTKQELIDIVEKRAAEKTLDVIESEMMGYYNLATVDAVSRDMCNWFLSLLKDLNTEHPIRWVEPKYTAQETALDAVIQRIAKEKADEEAAFMEAFIARTAAPVEEFSFGDDFWYGSAYGSKDIWKCRKFDWDGNEINYTMILENNKKVAECRILENILGHKFECKYYK